MNLKSLIKDDHWMRRVRKLVNKLSLQKGMCHEDSIFGARTARCRWCALRSTCAGLAWASLVTEAAPSGARWCTLVSDGRVTRSVLLSTARRQPT